MATKKKAAKKTAAKSSLVLKFDPRIKGDPPPPWLRRAVTDAVRQRQLENWVNGIVRKVSR